MTGMEVASSRSVSVLPVSEEELRPAAWNDDELINAACAAIPRDKRKEAVAAILSLVWRPH